MQANALIIERTHWPGLYYLFKDSIAWGDEESISLENRRWNIYSIIKIMSPCRANIEFAYSPLYKIRVSSAWGSPPGMKPTVCTGIALLSLYHL